MKVIKKILILVSFIPTLGWAQAPETDALSKTEITRLGFIVGHWEGKGWMFGQDRTRREFNQVENISFKLDSTAILVEGKGFSGGKAIHDAMAIISFNKIDKNYSFYS